MSGTRILLLVMGRAHRVFNAALLMSDGPEISSSTCHFELYQQITGGTTSQPIPEWKYPAPPRLEKAVRMAPQKPRGCWTCRDRKVRCDRGLPSCLACAKSKRKCQGYGLRLSWPQPNDLKRSLVGPRLAQSHMRQENEDKNDDDPQDARSVKSYTWVHTGSEDIEVYQDVIARRGDLASWKRYVQLDWPAPTPNSPLIWGSLELGDGGNPLVQYFYTIAYTAVPSFSAYSTTIRGLLVRMAFSNNGLPARALRYGMLALASVHRSDDITTTATYKALALRALASSVHEIDGDSGEAARHVAAVMLLSSLYMQACYMTGNEWLGYLAGARELTKRSRFAAMAHDSDDIAELMDWVYHQDVFSRFTSYYWRRGEGNPHRQLSEVPGYKVFNHPLEAPRESRQMLSMFQDVFEVMEYDDTAEENCEFSREKDMGRLTALQDHFRNIKYVRPAIRSPDGQGVAVEVEGDVAGREAADMPLVFDLYRLSALVCLAKTGESRFGWSSKVDELVDEAVVVMNKMETCQRQFPLVVLGSQARTDKQRRAVSELLDRTTKQATGRTIGCLRKTIEVSWVQTDLHADQDLLLDFGQLIRALCGNCLSVPNLG